jgi:hypothetical protein
VQNSPVSVQTYPDDARRISDAMNLHAVAKSRGWACFALADGTSPDGNTVYATREEAILFRRWDRDNFIYLQLQPDGMTEHDAHEFLRYARFLNQNGYRLPDPRDFSLDDPGNDTQHRPFLKSDALAQVRELTGRKRLTGRL